MSNVEFEGDFDPGTTQTSSQQNYLINSFGQRNSGGGGMTQWLMKKGIIKDESQAKVVLLGIVVFNIVLTAIIIYFFI